MYVKDKRDSSLSADVEDCLHSILEIVCQARHLRGPTPPPLEVDRRHQMDSLGVLVWNVQSDGLEYWLERYLQIPVPSPCSGVVKPDACAFIQVSGKVGDLATPDVSSAMPCFPRTGTAAPEYCLILHWVTEFKRNHDEGPSKSQVVEGLVSGLYQRRELGFPNHFVFGTAHYSRHMLEVLAATWVPSDKPAHPGADLMQEMDPQSVAPLVARENEPAKSLQPGDDSVDQEPRTGEKLADADTNLTVPGSPFAFPLSLLLTTNRVFYGLSLSATSSPYTFALHSISRDLTLTAEDIKKHDKVLFESPGPRSLIDVMQIVVYSIAKYSMFNIQGLLQLYLLMRQTGILAHQYKEEIEKLSYARLMELLRDAKEIYQWPPPPLPESNMGSTRSTTPKRKKMDDQIDAMDNMSIDPDDSFDSESDSEELNSFSDADGPYTATGDGSYAVTGNGLSYVSPAFLY
ncbi:hypothetical protein FRC11_003941 [Ceratobasidium sp. 423]|nr:hypothetical protein FRC11_003941 [Ceratobasidium sp. 423]